MDRTEMANLFDILYNNISSIQAPGLNAYEVSYFLTKSQEEVVVGLYNGSLSGVSFEETEQLRRYLSNLIVEKTLSPEPVESQSSDTFTGMEKSKSSVFKLPLDDKEKPLIWFITYEVAECSNADCDDLSKQDVVPVTQDEYNKIKRNPFRGANYRRALRLDLDNNRIEIVSDKKIESYYIRGLRKPSPIITETLPDNLTIDGYSIEADCKLHEALHKIIVDRAVLLAAQSYKSTGTNNSK